MSHIFTSNHIDEWNGVFFIIIIYCHLLLHMFVPMGFLLSDICRVSELWFVRSSVADVWLQVPLLWVWWVCPPPCQVHSASHLDWSSPGVILITAIQVNLIVIVIPNTNKDMIREYCPQPISFSRSARFLTPAIWRSPRWQPMARPLNSPWDRSTASRGPLSRSRCPLNSPGKPL